MSASGWDWGGSRWWKIDFHTHTPASSGDYGSGPDQASLRERTPRDWLLDYMDAGIDCVAITDHNSGAWIDDLKSELGRMADEEPQGYRPLVLFPGVEISVNGGVHLLAILDPASTTSDVDTLLGSVGFQGAKGRSDDVTSKSFVDVVTEIEKAGGIAIPAHVDGPKGIFNELTGTTLGQILACTSIFAMEVVDETAPKPPLYKDRAFAWTEVIGSDAHHPPGAAASKYPGSHFTWVKMGAPTLDGLRLALLDGSLSVRRSDVEGVDPNAYPPLAVESIEVSQACYMGRAQPFRVAFNPWLNTIIGGRGTGKSTLVEFLRIAMRRQDEVPEALAGDLGKYSEVYRNRGDEGLLTAQTRFVVTYRKDGARFRVQWSPDGDLDAILEEHSDGTWVRGQGDVTQRFPVRIYSQKQIFQLAKAPLALLRVVDEAAEVDHRSWERDWKREEAQFLSLRAKAREIEAGLVEEPSLRGELDDVTRKLAVYESAGHADVLKNFQNRRRQQRAVEVWEESWNGTGDRLRQVADELLPTSLDASSLDLEAEADRALHGRAELVRQGLEEIRRSLADLADKADKVRAVWQADKEASKWTKEIDLAVGAYEELKAKLAEEGAVDPRAYGEFVQSRHAIEQRLEELAARRKQMATIRRQADQSLTHLCALRGDLTRRRSAFIEQVLDSNRYVKITVLPYGAKETVEGDLRRLLQLEGRVFEKDIGTLDRGGLVGKIHAAGPAAKDIENALAAMKNEIRSISAGRSDVGAVHDKRFAIHLGKLPPEALDRLDLWFPEDSLDVQYSAAADGERFRSIQEGSPGQKTAALLAFLLSYGEEPMILDQPEDDLDNHLIYELIVTQLRDVKLRRQLIVVTHNANIVVNGDAELVVALVPLKGETQKECDASLQERKTRETICAVMEGGLDAFEQRYRRIALKGRHV